MSEDRDRASVLRLLSLVADHLEEFLEGNELALETLGESLEQGGFGAEDLQAVVLALRSLAGEGAGPGTAAVDDPPGRASQRVLSAQERESLSPEAWGYLLDLRRRGSLDPEQLERVMDRLAASGVRPVGVELAREVAARVALRAADGGLEPHGDADLAH
ncbi:MAG TPA: DUF494 family protein [Candidatus Eisenbacteria bacterium]|jgi:uncharacterized protein Smg (DUF494 family)